MATIDSPSAAIQELDPVSSSQPRRRRSATSPRRGRNARQASGDLMAGLVESVDRLLKENRELKQALARAEKREYANAPQGPTAKALAGLQRRLSRALGAAPAQRRRTPAASPTSARPRRRVTDPEILERRRQALVKARAVRAANRQAATQ